MMRVFPKFVLSIFCFVFFSFVLVCFAQDISNETTPAVAASPEITNETVDQIAPVVSLPEVPGEAASQETAQKSELITLDFKEADIRDVLKIISYKSGVNIVASPEVAGTVNVRISEVPWERALDVILKTYGYAYDKQDRIIMVAPLEKLTAQRKMEQDLAQVQPTQTEVVELKYIDAIDARKAIEPQLAPRGRITILEVTGQSGWGFRGSFR